MSMGITREGLGRGPMTRKHYCEELKMLSDSLTQMATSVETMLILATQSLELGSTEMAEILLRGSESVDVCEIEIEKHCLEIIALQQPVGRDLRLISGSVAIAMDLQRIGEHARKIARITCELPTGGRGQTPNELRSMTDAVRSMVHSVVSILETQALDGASGVTLAGLEAEDALADLRTSAHAAMARGSAESVTASYLLSAAHHLTESAGLAVDITERLSYAMTGRSPRALPAI
ncbi:MAG: phosphate uptake regulator, PhoU [Capsulimonas sp.]|jgi:phosphate transport system protein|nr:phosphate uptake regulator, PhoU [Capsulimonas sp.]